MHCLFWIFGGLTSLKRLMLRCLICLNLLYWSFMVRPSLLILNRSYWALLGLILHLHMDWHCTLQFIEMLLQSKRIFQKICWKYNMFPSTRVLCRYFSLMPKCYHFMINYWTMSCGDPGPNKIISASSQHNGQLGTRVILKIWIGFSEHGIPKENVT